MNQNSNGGPAFPSNDQAVAHTIAAAAIEGIEDAAERDRVYIAARAQAQQGMSLRDYFAAKFMQGFIAAPDREENYSHVTKADCAKLSYEMADAMLAERAK
jgi:hypothetical protein